MKEQVINLALAIIVTLLILAALYVGSEVALP